SLRRLAKELGVAPATVHWHVRSKDDLIAALVNSVFQDFAAIPTTSGSWVERTRHLYVWFRRQVLARIKILAAPTAQSVLPYAFPQAGMAGAAILAEAGFAGDELSSASRALFMLTFGSVIHEASIAEAFSPSRTPKQALDHALLTLRGEDVGRMVES